MKRTLVGAYDVALIIERGFSALVQQGQVTPMIELSPRAPALAQMRASSLMS